MWNVSSREAVRSKAEKLLEETKKLAFAEMDGKGITISIGIALYPEHGNTSYGIKWNRGLYTS